MVGMSRKLWCENLGKEVNRTPRQKPGKNYFGEKCQLSRNAGFYPRSAKRKRPPAQAGDALKNNENGDLTPRAPGGASIKWDGLRRGSSWASKRRALSPVSRWGAPGCPSAPEGKKKRPALRAGRETARS